MSFKSHPASCMVFKEFYTLFKKEISCFFSGLFLRLRLIFQDSKFTLNPFAPVISKSILPTVLQSSLLMYILKTLLLELSRFPGLSRTRSLFPGFSRPAAGKFQSRIPGLSRFSRTHMNPVFNSPYNYKQPEVTTRILVCLSKPKNIKVLIAPDNVNPSLPTPSQEWRWVYFDLCLNRQCVPYVRTLFDFTQGETILGDFCKATDALKFIFARTVQEL